MSPFEHVLAVWKDADARRGPIERAAGREPLLLQLGRLYRQRFLGSVDSRNPPDDWRLRELENEVGMQVTAGPEEGGWMEHVAAGWVNVADAQPNPEAVLVLGQAGAGKGAIVEELCQYFLTRGGCLVIDRYDLQYLHPNYAALLGEDDRIASRAVFADVVDLVESLYHRALAGKKNLVLDGSLLDAPSASNVVSELHAHGCRMSVLVLCAPPDVSWRATQERYERQRRVMGVGRWIDRAGHDESCEELLAALRAVEEQGLVDEIHFLTREGEGLLSSFRACGHVPGRGEQRLRAYWNPSIEPPAVPMSGGRRVKVGSFRAATAGLAAATPAPTEPSIREQPQTGRKGVKMGNFVSVPSGPAPEENAAPPAKRPTEPSGSTVRRADTEARSLQKPQPSAAEERAIQRRRMLQAKLRAKVKPKGFDPAS